MKTTRMFLTARGVRLLTLAAVVVLLSFGAGAARRAAAHEPHPGLEFHIGADTNGDTVDDCSTIGDAAGFCALPIGTMFTVNAYLDSLGVASYDGMTVWEDFTGIVSKGRPSPFPWPDCGLPVKIDAPGYTAAGCALGIGAPSSMYTGKVATATYTCAADGVITLHHGLQFTSIVDSNFGEHAEAGPDVLNIRCFASSLGGVADYPNISSGTNAGWLASVLAGALAVLLVSGAFAWRRKVEGRQSSARIGE